MGGATLAMHSRGSTVNRIRDGGYDVVVLQGDIPENFEQTVEPFLESARSLDQEVRDSGGKTVFYMTWPFARKGWIGLDRIAAAHRQVESGLGAPVAPAGVAFANALTERPDLAMLGDDVEHQTVHGAYLAANVIYATLFDRSPEGLAYRPDGVSDGDAAFLQRIAWETVQAWQAGEVVPPPGSTVAVTATEGCFALDQGAGLTAQTSYADGVWRISQVPLQCSFRASDPRLTGTSKNVFNCDCRYGVGCPIWGAWEVSNSEGSWVGAYRGVKSADGKDHAVLVAEGTGSYEGLTFMANLD